MIVTDSRHPADRAALDTMSRRERVTDVTAYDAVFDEIRRGGARAFVVDIDEWPPGAAHELCHALKSAATEAPVILRTGLTARAMMELPHLAHSESLRRVRLSFRGHESLEPHLGSEAHDDPGCATFDILKATFGLIPLPERHVWVATVVMCRQAVLRDAVGARVAMGKDKLRETYNQWGLPSFPDVNAEILCAHLLAAAEGGASVDRCAAGAGFSGVTALDNYVNRHFDLKFAQLRGERSLAAQVERVSRLFGRA